QQRAPGQLPGKGDQTHGTLHQVGTSVPVSMRPVVSPPARSGRCPRQGLRSAQFLEIADGAGLIELPCQLQRRTGHARIEYLHGEVDIESGVNQWGKELLSRVEALPGAVRRSIEQMQPYLLLHLGALQAAAQQYLQQAALSVTKHCLMILPMASMLWPSWAERSSSASRAGSSSTSLIRWRTSSPSSMRLAR